MATVVATLPGLYNVLVDNADAAGTGSFEIYGNGAVSCGTYLQHRSQNGKLYWMDAAWVEGWLSCINATGGGDILEGTDIDGAMAWIANYCRAHPLRPFSVATEDLSSHLVSKWMRSHKEK
ncbi:hypothetical protein JKG47_15920 [Acidithiobacillus sp. MC6.1]|nr:hypothetical protein [Acidithiobacillus sp. MC6.1]